MPSLEKECPGCGTIVHVRKLRCPCGHVFHRLKNKSLTVRKQALEATKVANASSQIRKRALETNKESKQRKKNKCSQSSTQESLGN